MDGVGSGLGSCTATIKCSQWDLNTRPPWADNAILKVSYEMSQTEVGKATLGQSLSRH